MTSPRVKMKVVIPFRDRGTDLRRAANLDVVMAWWWLHKIDPVVQGDGLEDDAPFNRHRAYNLAVSENPDTDVFVFSEADMLVPTLSVVKAVKAAVGSPGLVVPFTEYRYLSDETTTEVRDRMRDSDEYLGRLIQPPGRQDSVFDIEPESTMEGGRSIGAVNVVSRATLNLTGGFTEATHGNWYDDNITEEGFAFLCGAQTRWVKGPAVHLYHLPGWKGDHLTAEDKAATAHNRSLLINMRADIIQNDAAAVRTLMELRA